MLNQIPCFGIVVNKGKEFVMIMYLWARLQRLFLVIKGLQIIPKLIIMFLIVMVYIIGFYGGYGFGFKFTFDDMLVFTFLFFLYWMFFGLSIKFPNENFNHSTNILVNDDKEGHTTRNQLIFLLLIILVIGYSVDKPPNRIKSVPRQKF